MTGGEIFEKYRRAVRHAWHDTPALKYPDTMKDLEQQFLADLLALVGEDIKPQKNDDGWDPEIEIMDRAYNSALAEIRKRIGGVL